MRRKETSELTVLVDGELFFLAELEDNVRELAQVLRAHPEMSKISKQRSANFIVNAYNTCPTRVRKVDLRFAKALL